MEGQHKGRLWLNPHYQKSETEASTCGRNPSNSVSYLPQNSSSSMSTLFSGERMKKVFSCFSGEKSYWKTFNSSLTSFKSEDKEVVMEGLLPTTKNSLMTFLKGMGLRPKVEFVGKETIISADLSVISDETLKQKFIDLMRRQVVLTPTPTKATSRISSSSTTNTASSRSTQSQHNNTHCNIPKTSPQPSEDLRRLPPRTPIRTNSRDSLAPGPFKTQPDGTLPPGPLKPAKKGAKDLPPVPWGPKKSKDEKPPAEEKDIARSTEVAILPNNFELNEILNEAPSMSQPPKNNGGQKQGVSFAYHGQGTNLPRWECIQGSTRKEPHTSVGRSDIQNNDKGKKKRKKVRVMKHLRRWISRKKKSKSPDVPSCNYENLNDPMAVPLYVRTGNDWKSESSNGYCQKAGSDCDLVSNDGYCQKTDCNSVSYNTHCERNQGDSVVSSGGKFSENIGTVGAIKDGSREQKRRGNTRNKTVDIKTNMNMLDGSISMPVLLSLENRSCFKITPYGREMAEASKSSTMAVGPVEHEPASYSVVGDSAAIHLAKNRITLEGKDVKYGSILHKDENFDNHFKVLEETSMHDIENQVNKVKERIMFARAIDAVSGGKTDDAPEVNMKTLLFPVEKDKHSKKGKAHVDIVAKSSFYQKFLASMNILKCTDRSDACDRSVMTDEPISKTYADFMIATEVMRQKNLAECKKNRNKSHTSNSARWDTLSSSDSFGDLSNSYITKICQCWPSLFPANKEPPPPMKTHCKFEPSKMDEERFLKYLVNKVVDCSRNKKKGYIKTKIFP